MDLTSFREIFGYSLAAGIVIALVFIVHKFKSTKIEINVTDDAIIFKTETNTITFAPYLCISKGSKRKRLLSVGQETPPMEPHILVSLVGYAGEAGGEKEYYECLSAFFRFAFYKVINRRFFVLPKVSMVGAEKLTSNFPSSEKTSIYKALKHAGAIECKIV